MITNYQDVIDSRDVTDRIEELKAGEELSGEEREELDTLLGLSEQGKDSPDWEYGETLIRDSYFEEYAQELAEDTGAVATKDFQWPLYCIDWEWAARDLKLDYLCVDFDGVEYWIRG